MVPKPDIVSPWYTAGDRYEYFDDTDNVVEWESLVIIAERRPSSFRIRPRSSGSVDGLEVDRLPEVDNASDSSRSGSVITVDDLCPICFVWLDD
jgi:hypothetical protein